MTEWTMRARYAMDLCDERRRSPREPIVLERPVGRALRTLVEHLLRSRYLRQGMRYQGSRRIQHASG